MSNVIKFPKQSDMPTTSEEVHEVMSDVINKYIMEYSLFLADVVESQLETNGFVTEDDDEAQEYWMFLVDALAAIVAKRKGYNHPMHALITEYISAEVPDEPEPKETTKKTKKPKAKKT